jgi:hypothetical protein
MQHLNLGYAFPWKARVDNTKKQDPVPFLRKVLGYGKLR